MPEGLAGPYMEAPRPFSTCISWYCSMGLAPVMAMLRPSIMVFCAMAALQAAGGGAKDLGALLLAVGDQREVLDGVAEILHLGVGDLVGGHLGDHEGLVDDGCGAEHALIDVLGVVAGRGRAFTAAGDGDRGGVAGEGEGGILGDGHLVGGDDHGRNDGGYKSGFMRFETIGSRGDGGEGVLAGVVGGGLQRSGGVRVAQRDDGAGDHGLVGIFDGAGDLAGLCEGLQGSEKQDQGTEGKEKKGRSRGRRAYNGTGMHRAP